MWCTRVSLGLTLYVVSALPGKSNGGCVYPLLVTKKKKFYALKLGRFVINSIKNCDLNIKLYTLV